MEELKPIKIEGLYYKAYRAHLNTSFSPEKRAETYVKEYEEELNTDLQSMPEGERPEYIQRYTRHLFAWLSAKSNCLSSMITGPARFPVARAEKANRTETNRYNDFREWRDKALKRIRKRIDEAKSPEQKTNERWEVLKKEISQKIAWGSVANCYSMLERLAYNGEGYEQDNRAYFENGKSGTLDLKSESRQKVLLNNYRIRRLTPTECARLQTIPDWYKWECSDTQAYRMLGNGWTNEVIKHIFNYLPKQLTSNEQQRQAQQVRTCTL